MLYGSTARDDDYEWINFLRGFSLRIFKWGKVIYIFIRCRYGDGGGGGNDVRSYNNVISEENVIRQML